MNPAAFDMQVCSLPKPLRLDRREKQCPFRRTREQNVRFRGRPRTGLIQTKK